MEVVATGGDELAVDDEEDGFGCGMVGGTGFICGGMEEGGEAAVPPPASTKRTFFLEVARGEEADKERDLA